MTSWKQSGGDPQLIQSKVHALGPPSKAHSRRGETWSPLCWSDPLRRRHLHPGTRGCCTAMPGPSCTGLRLASGQKEHVCGYMGARETQSVPWWGKMKEWMGTIKGHRKTQKPKMTLNHLLLCSVLMRFLSCWCTATLFYICRTKFKIFCRSPTSLFTVTHLISLHLFLLFPSWRRVVKWGGTPLSSMFYN